MPDARHSTLGPLLVCLCLCLCLGALGSASAQLESVTEEEARAMTVAEQGVLLVTIAERVKRSDDLEEAYRLWFRSARIAELSGENDNGYLRPHIRDLYNDLDPRITAWYEDAAATYVEEDGHGASLAVFESVAGMERASAQGDAARQVRLEPDRAAWREASAAYAAGVEAGDLSGAARQVGLLTRLGPPTGYGEPTDAIVEDFAGRAALLVDAAAGLIENGSYLLAYRNLDTVAQVRRAGEASVRARRLLAEHADEPGMVEAKRVVDAEKALAQVLEMASGLEPGDRQMRAMSVRAQRVADRYPDTPAGEEAAALSAEWLAGFEAANG